MHSRMVNSRRRRAVVIDAAVVEQAGEIVEQAARLLSEDLSEGEALPDLGQLVELLRRRIGRQTQTLLHADTLEKEEQAVRSLARRRRDQAAARVRDLLVAFRTVVDKAQGPGAAAEAYDLGTSGGRDALELLAKAERVQQRLSNQAFHAAEAATPVPFDPAAWLAAFAAPIVELSRAIAESANSLSRQDDRTAARRAQLGVFDVAVKDGVKLLASVFSFGGRPELARKLQLGRRRPASASGQGAGPVEAPAPVPPAPLGLVEPEQLPLAELPPA